MELDQPKLLLIFNVVAITAVTSLTVIWYLRKRDQQAVLANFDLPLQRVQLPIQAAPPPPPPALLPPAESVEEPPIRDPQGGKSPVAMPAMRFDIRHYVTNRAQDWKAPSLAQWNQPVSQRMVIADNDNQVLLPQLKQVVLPRHRRLQTVAQSLAAPMALNFITAPARNESLFRPRGAVVDCGGLGRE